MTRPDIRRPEDVDAAWLTSVLRDGGVEAEVKRFTAASVGTGQIGESVRFSLGYDAPASNAPRSLVGKFPSPDEASRATGVALGNYHREVRFYQHLASSALIQTPRCYFADVEEASGDFVLMMEDLAPAEQGDQLRGVTFEQARLVVGEAAKLHASHWGDESLDALPWVSNSAAAPSGSVTPDLVLSLWEGFKQRYKDRLDRERLRAGDFAARNYAHLGRLHDGPRCLTHNDYRPDNMMFATSAGGRPVTVLDWQSFAFGAGPTDVAYFLAGALATSERRRREAELLDLYHDVLLRHGVTGYSRGELDRHYAQGGYLLLLTAFFAAMVVKRTERGDAMFLRMLEGAADHMIDHGMVG